MNRGRVFPVCFQPLKQQERSQDEICWLGDKVSICKLLSNGQITLFLILCVFCANVKVSRGRLFLSIASQPPSTNFWLLSCVVIVVAMVEADLQAISQILGKVTRFLLFFPLLFCPVRSGGRARSEQMEGKVGLVIRAAFSKL